jgi:hypothetical protein
MVELTQAMLRKAQDPYNQEGAQKRDSKPSIRSSRARISRQFERQICENRDAKKPSGESMDVQNRLCLGYNLHWTLSYGLTINFFMSSESFSAATRCFIMLAVVVLTYCSAFGSQNLAHTGSPSQRSHFKTRPFLASI